MKIRVKSLSFDSFGFATMMDDCRRVFVELDNGPSYWLPEEDLQQVVYLCDCSPNYCCCNDTDREFSPDVTEYIALRMHEELNMKDPKGILAMSKQVRLVVGEGDDKIEVGVAEVEKLPNGDSMISLSITNGALIKALGAIEINGIIPKLVDPEPDDNEEKIDE
jgi:hypothetical protein